MRWGATPEEWAHFDLMLGLTADLLPVVSNPEAQISPESRMKGLGKTPSAYNRAGFVAGLKDWTDRQTTPAQIEKWSAVSDYGICLQTRSVRALDIDVPDHDLAAAIQSRFADLVGRSGLPARGRADSGKRLVGFTLPGDFRKRSFKVEGGLVEFLATGQQFIVSGTHPGGARYIWTGGLPRDFPEIDADDFERAWSALVAEYAIEPERRSVRREASGPDGGGHGEDATAVWLEANWPTFGTQGGKLFVECPWKLGHSGDSGETEAAWLLAGTGGYAMGHFECLHASCSDRTDQQFLAEVGWKPAQASDFQDIVPRSAPEATGADPVALYLAAAGDLPDPAPRQSTKVKATAPHPTGISSLPLPGFERDKQGRILATVGNVAKAAAAPQACGVRLRFDTFRGELVVASPDEEDWRPFEDADAVDMRIALAQIGFEPVSKELMRDAIVKVARDHRFDTAIHWLENIVPEWDGTERIDRFYPDYFNTADNLYTRACGLYVWTAHAGRVLVPGVKADMAPVMIGKQGLRKTSGIKAISPAEEFFLEIDLDKSDEALAREMRGVLVGELGELKGLSGRDSEGIRAWVSRQAEKWVPKYQEYSTTFMRRLLLHGSGNKNEFLADDTGERRWLPMMVLDMVDVDRIEADRLQLWAEARQRFLMDGVLWQEAERLARNEHHKFKVIDPWTPRVERWLDTAETTGLSPRMVGVTSEDVMVSCIGLDLAKVRKGEEMRVAAVLKACGMERVQKRWGPDQRNTKVWVDANDDLR